MEPYGHGPYGDTGAGIKVNKKVYRGVSIFLVPADNPAEWPYTGGHGGKLGQAERLTVSCAHYKPDSADGSRRTRNAQTGTPRTRHFPGYPLKVDPADGRGRQFSESPKG